MASNLEIIGDGEVIIGERTSIGAGAKVIFHKPSRVTIGDYCSIGPGVKFVVSGGTVEIGDWTTLHDDCLVLSTQGVKIGQHGWFGQNTVLDGSGGLTIGNGVRVGMYSQIWSHVAAGERIEGCTLYGERPVVIEDDVWLVGSCICASGVTIGRRTVALIGSNITRSWPAEVVLAGAPAKKKEGLSFYKPVTPQEKWEMLTGWLHDVKDELGIEEVDGGAADALVYRWADGRADEAIAFVVDGAGEAAARARLGGATICNIETKTYGKKLTTIEQRVLKALANNKARFLAA
jgi:acetyltransferase-like isoleucine patch superfamily enzyme